MASEEDEGDLIRVHNLNDESSQLYVVKTEATAERVVLVNYKLGVGFSIPLNYAYQLGHMILHAVSEMGGDEETPENQTFH